MNKSDLKAALDNVPRVVPVAPSLVDLWRMSNVHIRRAAEAQYSMRLHPFVDPTVEDGAGVMIRKIEGGKLGYVRGVAA